MNLILIHSNTMMYFPAQSHLQVHLRRSREMALSLARIDTPYFYYIFPSDSVQIVFQFDDTVHRPTIKSLYRFLYYHSAKKIHN